MCFQFNLLCSSGYHRVSCLGTLSLDKFFLFYSMCSFIWQLLFPQFTEGQSLCKSVRVISFFSTLPTYMSYPDGVICLWTLFLTDKIIWPGKLAHFMYRKILTEPYFLYTVNKHVQMWKQKPGSVEEKNQKENLPNLLFSWSAFALIILTQRGMKLQNLGFFFPLYCCSFGGKDSSFPVRVHTYLFSSNLSCQEEFTGKNGGTFWKQTKTQ